MSAQPCVSAVLPTYNRLPALTQALDCLLSQPELAEVIVVDDGSTDGTDGFLAQYEDPRVVVHRMPENVGSTGARNAGLALASSAWILLFEDDVQIPRDFLAVLLEEAGRLKADVISAPWVYTWGKPLDLALERSRAAASSHFTMNTHPGTHPVEPVETPFLPGVTMIARGVVDAGIRYDTSYKYNSWREETSLFVHAAEKDFSCWLTGSTYSYQNSRFGGGQPRHPLRYEYHALRNNWRFLTRHRSWLLGHTRTTSLVQEQSLFVVLRFRLLGRRVAARVFHAVRQSWHA